MKSGIGMNRWMMVAIVCAALAVVALVAFGNVWLKWHDCRFELELLQVQLIAEKLD